MQFSKYSNNILLEIDFEDTLKEIDPNMTENIQPRILLVDNIYIKDRVDNETTHGREEHNIVAELELTKNDMDVIQQGPDERNLTDNIKGQMDALKINSQRIFDFGQRCAKSTPTPPSTTTVTATTFLTSKYIHIISMYS